MPFLAAKGQFQSPLIGPQIFCSCREEPELTRNHQPCPQDWLFHLGYPWSPGLVDRRIKESRNEALSPLSKAYYEPSQVKSPKQQRASNSIPNTALHSPSRHAPRRGLPIVLPSLCPRNSGMEHLICFWGFCSLSLIEENKNKRKSTQSQVFKFGL
jgi:hypothetical protein